MSRGVLGISVVTIVRYREATNVNSYGRKNIYMDAKEVQKQ